jgi:hypothetical protein
MPLPALPEPWLAASLIRAGYAAAAGAAGLAAAAGCAVIVPLSRKRVSWDALLDMPVGLSRQGAPAPEAGWAGELVLGEHGLRYPGPWTAGIEQGWLVLVGITNPGPSAVRSADFSIPLTFAFPGRQVRASRILPEPAGPARRRAPRAPAVRMAARRDPDAGQAAISATGVQLSGDFLLRPGDSYSLLLMLTGTPAGRSRRIHHEGALTGGRIIPPW